MSADFPETKSGEGADERMHSAPGLERGLRILAEFSRKEPRLSAPEFAKRLQIPRTTVFRLLQTLEAQGFVERMNREPSYQLGVEVPRLGFGYLKSLPTIQHGSPVIEQLRDRMGSTVHLVIRDGTEIVYAAKAEAPASKLGTVKISLGTRLPAHATVHGQILLGDFSVEALRTLYADQELKRFTAYTPSTVEELHARVVELSAQGYGISESYFESGVSAVSAPVRERTGRIVAVVAATLARPKLEEAMKHSGLVDEVLLAARTISDALQDERRPKRTRQT